MRVLVSGVIDESRVKEVYFQLGSEDFAEVTLVIDCMLGGGLEHVRSIEHLVLARVDRPRLHTHVLANACCAGLLLSQLAPAGNRTCLPHSVFLDRPPRKVEGQADDSIYKMLEAQYTEFRQTYLPGIPRPGSDRWMTAQEALEAGVVDEIIRKETL